MSEERKYALDSSIFVEAKRRYYAFDLCPGFWDALLWHQGNGFISSIDRVKAELARGADDLTDWINGVMPDVCFSSTDDTEVINWFSKTIAWVQAQPQFLSAAKAEYAAAADGWLIAYAKAYNLVLVTHEVVDPKVRRRVPIPNVCSQFNVKCIDTFDMLRDLRTKFIWEQLSGLQQDRW